MVIAATPLSDERLGLLSDLTSGHALTASTVGEQGGVEIIAEGGRAAPRSVFQALRTPDVLARAASSLESGLTMFDDATNVYAAEPLATYGGTRVVLAAGVTQSLVPNVAGLLWPIFAVTLLGMSLVVAGGIFLGNYISQPISELEEGLLSVINGRTNLRFEIEHPDLGGLVFRINSLLNALMGVPETDVEGRTSSPPGAPYREAEP
jgi:methyl-accepting chemotaxis protein